MITYVLPIFVTTLVVAVFGRKHWKAERAKRFRDRCEFKDDLFLSNPTPEEFRHLLSKGMCLTNTSMDDLAKEFSTDHIAVAGWMDGSIVPHISFRRSLLHWVGGRKRSTR